MARNSTAARQYAADCDLLQRLVEGELNMRVPANQDIMDVLRDGFLLCEVEAGGRETAKSRARLSCLPGS